MALYFVKTTETGNGIVVSNKPLTEKTVTLKNGAKKTVRVNQSDIQFGFVAFVEGGAKELGYEKGETMPLKFSDKKVTNKDGEELNLYWCNPE